MRWHFFSFQFLFFCRSKSIRVSAKVLVIDHSDNYNKRHQLSMSTCMTMKQVKNNWIPQTPKWNFNLHPTNGPTPVLTEQPSLIADQYAKCVRAKISVNFPVKGTLGGGCNMAGGERKGVDGRDNVHCHTYLKRTVNWCLWKLAASLDRWKSKEFHLNASFPTPTPLPSLSLSHHSLTAPFSTVIPFRYSMASLQECTVFYCCVQPNGFPFILM